MAKYGVSFGRGAVGGLGAGGIARILAGKNRDVLVESAEEVAAFYGDGLAMPQPDLAKDAVAVGDLNSDARGSGARKNSGKPQWHQLPLWAIAGATHAWERVPVSHQSEQLVWNALKHMAEWQRGDDDALNDAIASLLGFFHVTEGGAGVDSAEPLELPPLLPLFGLEGVVRVLEFGEKKYKKANWAKGMPWSVCYDCTISHLRKHILGHHIDEESGQHTLYHALCNMLFLSAYKDLYPEGDDRITEFSHHY